MSPDVSGPETITLPEQLLATWKWIIAGVVVLLLGSVVLEGIRGLVHDALGEVWVPGKYESRGNPNLALLGGTQSFQFCQSLALKMFAAGVAIGLAVIIEVVLLVVAAGVVIMGDVVFGLHIGFVWLSKQVIAATSVAALCVFFLLSDATREVELGYYSI